MSARNDDLAERHCTPGRRGSSPLDPATTLERLGRLEGWQLGTAGRSLAKVYSFGSYAAALAFVNRVAGFAEAENHHPELLLSWRKVRVELTTYAAGGLTENDFILAAKIDRAMS